MNGDTRPLFADVKVQHRRQPVGTGLLPSQAIRRMGEKKLIWARDGIQEDQIQPASLDLRLGETAYRVQASFLPGRHATVTDKLRLYAMQEIDLTHGALLETGCVYVVKLLESFYIPKDIYGLINPKSSIGRLNVFTRIITDYSVEFDQVGQGYRGPLYAEIAPLAFSIIARRGSKLAQVRFKRGRPYYGEDRLRELHRQIRGLQGDNEEEPTYRGGIPVTVDARGTDATGLIGFRAMKNTAAIDVDKRRYYSPSDYWEPVYAGRNNGVILSPGEFYILASREPIVIPPDHAAEMVAYDPLVGEFRVHYAGFFDPAFGHEAGGGGGGTKAVLEVRSHDVPFVVQDGQIVGRLMYERLAALPDKLYSATIGSSYQKQSLSLSTHFRTP